MSSLSATAAGLLAITCNTTIRISACWCRPTAHRSAYRSSASLSVATGAVIIRIDRSTATAVAGTAVRCPTVHRRARFSVLRRGRRCSTVHLRVHPVRPQAIVHPSVHNLELAVLAGPVKAIRTATDHRDRARAIPQAAISGQALAITVPTPGNSGRLVGQRLSQPTTVTDKNKSAFKADLFLMTSS